MHDRLPPALALLDVDGTLLDSNDAHARAWVETLRRHGRPLPFERIRPQMGKGGDKVLIEMLGLDPDEPLARTLAEDRRRLFIDRWLPELEPTPGARLLLERMKQAGLRRIVATSAGGSELQALLRQADIADLIDDTATSSDVEHSKPDPDIIEVAIAKSGASPSRAIMVGDTPYDIDAAAAAGVATVALRCGGGWDDSALAKAIAIYDSPAALLADWDRSPFRVSG